MSNHEASVARIYGGAQAVGVGCLIGPRHVVTCAHVVSAALGGSDRAAEPPAGELRLDFPLVAGQPAVMASVCHWLPVLDDDRGDIALLALAAPAPEPARPARLVTTENLWEHPFRAYGFPAGVVGGEWASGRLLGRQATGWVQLEALRAQGGRVERGYSGGPVWDETVGGVVGIVVAARKSAETRMAYLIPSAEILRVSRPYVGDEGAGACPYRGLWAFREEHAGVFFGREEAVGHLVDGAGQRSLVAVLGASGCGKSSVVFAGLLPALRRTGRWAAVDFRPGRQPFESMAAALVPLLRPDLDVLERMRATQEVAALLVSLGMSGVLRQLTATLQGRRLLVVVDQFEELFTLCPDTKTRLSFVDSLLEVARSSAADPEPPVLVVLTMRADFLSQALAHRPLADALQGADVKLGPMTPAELKAAVERPAAVAGARFEDRLVARIVDDLRGEPGHLPLLEFALTMLWDRQTDGSLTHAAYEEVGGVDRALARHADSVYLSLTPKEQERARRVFVQLVKPGEGTEDTRRLATAGELSPEDWDVVRRLATKRLVVTDRDPAGEDTAEVAHEALIRGWDRLRDWLTSDREFRVWQERLRDALRLWRVRKEDDAVLLRGLLLVEAEEWLARRREEISLPEQHFLAVSRQHQNEQEQRYRELYEAALARQLAAQADLLRAGDRGASELAVLLAVEAVRRHASFDTDLALRRAIAGLGRSEAEHRPGRSGPAPTPGPTVVVADQVVRVLDPDRRELAAIRPEAWAHAAALSGDASLVAVALDDGTARIWEVGGAQLAAFRHDGLVNAVAFSPDGRYLASGGEDGAARLWDLAGGEVRRFAHDGLVNAVAFTVDGARLATAGQDGQARIWDVERGMELLRLPAIGDVPAVTFDEAGAYLGCGRPPSAWWPLRTVELVRNATALVGRELSPEERIAYVGSEGG